jgi:P27 family predicted phage terminase small subunit
MAPKKPKAPSELGDAGRKLWEDFVGDIDEDWSLDARDLHLLARACRCQDEMVELEGVVDAEGATTKGSRGQVVCHPALGEARQLRLVQHRLLAGIEKDDPNPEKGDPIASERGRKAANAKHSHRDRVRRMKTEARRG